MGKKLLLAGLLALLAPAACLASTVIWQSDFNADTIGSVPANWEFINTVPTPNIATGTLQVVDATTPDDITFGSPDQIVRAPYFYDPSAWSRTVRPTSYLRRAFPELTAGPGVAGKIELEFDIRIASADTSAFVVNISNGDGIDNANKFGVKLVFTRDFAWPGGADANSLSLTTTYNTPGYQTLAPYSVDTWYSVKIECFLDQTCKVWFAPKGQPLVDLTPTPLPWVKLATDPFTMTAKISRVSLGPQRNTTADGSVSAAYIDNVKVTGIGGAAEPALKASVGELRTVPKGAFVKIENAIVSAAPGTSGSWMYIQDNRSGGPGMRVLEMAGYAGAIPSSIALGDKVTVTGAIVQTADTGGAVLHTGERGIAAMSTSVTIGSPNDVPKPVAMLNRNVGGGWLGALETVSPGPEPMLKGVWPHNTSGIAANGDLPYFGNETLNSFSPLYNVGDLISVTGKVTKRLIDFEVDPLNPTLENPYDYYIDDGSLADDGWFAEAARTPKPAGVRIRVNKAKHDAIVAANGDITGKFVTVVGISGADTDADLTGENSTRNIRFVRLRAATDLVVANP